MNAQAVRTVVSGAVTELVLVAPAGNRLTVGDVEALTTQVTSASAGAVLLRGEGTDFCLGRDASAGPPARDEEQIRAELLRPILGLYQAVEDTPVPVVAAVRGRAFGLGFAIAAVADVVVAADDATFALPELAAGFAPLLALRALAPLVPRHTLFQLASTTEPVAALRLHDLGFVASVVPSTDVDRVAHACAADLAARPGVSDVKAFLGARTQAARQLDADYASLHLAEILTRPR